METSLEEYITKTYLTILDRSPDPMGLKSWLLKIRSGQIKKGKLAEELKKSEEYKRKPMMIAQDQFKPSSNYNISFKTMSEMETDIHIQFISHPHGSTDKIYHNSKAIHIFQGEHMYKAELISNSLDTSLTADHYLSIVPPVKGPHVKITEVTVDWIGNVIPIIDVPAPISIPIVCASTQPELNHEINKKVSKTTFVSSWKINCGIAIYADNLITAINRIKPDICRVHPLIDKHKVTGELVHLQNELGIMPEPPEVDRNSKVIITWHTVLLNMDDIIKKFESKLNVASHIVASKDSVECIKSTKEVCVIPLGSTLIPKIKKEDARQLIGNINIDKPIGFVFGLQSSNKEYSELINAAKNTDIHLIISGAKHDTGYQAKALLTSHPNVTFLDKYLSEMEVSLYALASDLLLFDYKSQPHYSCSAAMHRLISAGRPVICSDIKHFSELTDMKNALKFRNQKELEACITKALEPQMYETLSNAALEYAEETSWENIARKHLDIYSKHINI